MALSHLKPIRFDVSVGSFASVWPRTDDFRSTPINRHRYRASACLKSAKAEAASIFEPHLLVRGTRVATGDDGVRVGLCENKLTPPIQRTAALTRSERFVVTTTSHRSPAYSS